MNAIRVKRKKIKYNELGKRTQYLIGGDNMMVEIIESNNSFTLNLKLEQWLTNHKDYHKIVDIKFSSFFNSQENKEVWSALIIFKSKYKRKD